MTSQKFVYIDACNVNGQYWLIVKDIEWYLLNSLAISNWITESCLECTISGLILFFNKLEDVTFFLLKWER